MVHQNCRIETFGIDSISGFDRDKMIERVKGFEGIV